MLFRSTEEAARAHLDQLRTRGVRTAQVGVRQTPVPRSFLQVRGTLEDMRARVASLRERFPDTEVRNCRG